eukprot:COSAG02_NODE_152_length_33208_cov_13.316591_38_plen_207_part_00
MSSRASLVHCIECPNLSPNPPQYAPGHFCPSIQYEVWRAVLRYLEFASRRERDQAFERVDGSIFRKTCTKLKLEKCDRIKIVEEECSEAEAAAAEAAAAAAAQDSAEDKRKRLRQCVLLAPKRVTMKECWRVAIEKPCMQYLEEAMPRYVQEARDRQAAIKQREDEEARKSFEKIEQQRALAAQQRTQQLQARRQEREVRVRTDKS